MADSLLDLGATSDLFTLQPDWADGISSELGFGREIIQKNRGIRRIRSLTNDLPIRVTYPFSMLSKTDEYYLVNFFCARRGMNRRFWLPLWNQAFTLAAAIPSLAYTFTMSDNHFEDVVRYYERIFIYLKSGDMITRKILTNIGNVFTVETAFDRDIAISDILFFGRLLMARFDQDELEISHITNTVSTGSASFLELPKEYESSATGS